MINANNITLVSDMSEAEWEQYCSENAKRAEDQHYNELADMVMDPYGDDDEFERLVSTRQF